MLFNLGRRKRKVCGGFSQFFKELCCWVASLVKAGEHGVGCQLSSSQQDCSVYCSMYLQGDLVLLLGALLQYRKVLLLTVSLGESEYFCGWAGSKSAIMS